jgi:ABC-type transport system substrate-binding protein
VIKNCKKRLYDISRWPTNSTSLKTQKNVTYRLRENLHFRDSTPIAPEDVQWSYEN